MLSRAVVLALACSIPLLADGAAGIHWTPPAGWQSQGARPMRAATYVIPNGSVDLHPAECAVYYFGQHEGGTVDANMKRWISQFEGGEKNAKTGTRTIHGLTVHTVDVSGGYTGMGGPMAPAHAAQPGYRLLGAIVEAPQGLVFFKFTGPVKTIAANQSKYDAMLNSLAR